MLGLDLGYRHFAKDIICSFVWIAISYHQFKWGFGADKAFIPIGQLQPTRNRWDGRDIYIARTSGGVVFDNEPLYASVTQLNKRHNILSQWCHNERDGVSNHKLHDCLLNRLFRRRSKKTPKLHTTGLCEGNSPVTGEFPAQMASNAENVSIWWRRHVVQLSKTCRDWLCSHFHHMGWI